MTIEGRAGKAELVQCALDRTTRLLDEPDDLQLLGIGSTHIQLQWDKAAWHGAPDCIGTRLICDINFPDRGLHLIDLATTPVKIKKCSRPLEGTTGLKHEDVD